MGFHIHVLYSRRIRESSPPGLRKFAQIRNGFAKVLDRVCTSLQRVGLVRDRFAIDSRIRDRFADSRRVRTLAQVRKFATGSRRFATDLRSSPPRT
eukprot:7029642-Prymnesium_polylepis.1